MLPESPGHDCSVPASLILASKHDTKTCVKSLFEFSEVKNGF